VWFLLSKTEKLSAVETNNTEEVVEEVVEENISDEVWLGVLETITCCKDKILNF
jgi:hypothetical protein